MFRLFTFWRAATPPSKDEDGISQGWRPVNQNINVARSDVRQPGDFRELGVGIQKIECVDYSFSAFL
jgi:hypothetical protein